MDQSTLILNTSVKPIRINFADGHDVFGNRDYLRSIQTNMSLANLPAYSNLFVYAEYDKVTDQVSIGYDCRPPVYSSVDPKFPKYDNVIPVSFGSYNPGGIYRNGSYAGRCWSSGEHDSAKYQSWKMLNGTWNEYGWLFTGAVGVFVLDHHEPTVINSYRMIHTHNDAETAAVATQSGPKNWTLEAYDGVGWVVLDTRTNVTWSTAKTDQIFEFANNVAYKTYRLYITANGGLS